MILYYSGNSVTGKHPEYILGDKANVMLSYLQIKGGKERDRLVSIIRARKRRKKVNK